jgi:hypothetical protein
MSENLEAFLAARLPFPGLAGWGVRLPDRSVTHQAYVQWLDRGKIEQVLSRLALASDGIRNHDLRPRWLCWKFEHVKLHLAVRGEGTCLVLVVENQPEPSGLSLPDLLEDFLSLPS